MLYPDLTLFIQMGIFLVTFLILSQVFFKPYIALFNARDEAQGIERAAADHDPDEVISDEEPPHSDLGQGEVAQLRARVESLTADLHEETAKLRKGAMEDARNAIRKTLQEANDEAAGSIAAAQERVEGLRDDIWSSLRADQGKFIEQLQKKLLA